MMKANTMSAVKASSKMSKIQRSAPNPDMMPNTAPKFLMYVMWRTPGISGRMPVFSATLDTVQNLRN